MKRHAEAQRELQERRQRFRSDYKVLQQQRRADHKILKEEGNEPEMIVEGAFEKPVSIDMEQFMGSEWELEWTVERLFANVEP